MEAVEELNRNGVTVEETEHWLEESRAKCVTIRQPLLRAYWKRELEHELTRSPARMTRIPPPGRATPIISGGLRPAALPAREATCALQRPGPPNPRPATFLDGFRSSDRDEGHP